MSFKFNKSHYGRFPVDKNQPYTFSGSVHYQGKGWELWSVGPKSGLSDKQSSYVLIKLVSEREAQPILIFRQRLDHIEQGISKHHAIKGWLRETIDRISYG